jgi:hypothetical protein
MSVLLLAQDGTGLHGTNGLPRTTCIKLFNTYVLPRLLYGLERIENTNKELHKNIKK